MITIFLHFFSLSFYNTHRQKAPADRRGLLPQLMKNFPINRCLAELSLIHISEPISNKRLRRLLESLRPRRIAGAFCRPALYALINLW